jgi:hypothetical protein
VDEAYRSLAASAKELGIAELREPAGDGGSFLLADPDRNWWEIASPN